MGGLDAKALESALSKKDALPPCPEVVVRVAKLCADETASSLDIGRAIMADEAISAKLIRLANSAFYGLSGRVSTVTQAAIILGTNEIRSIVCALPARDLFAERGAEGGIDLSSLWSHSARVAVLARELAYSLRHEHAEEVFVGGIFHDIGQVILSGLLSKQYQDLHLEVWRAGADLASCERERLGMTHADVGKRLVEKWNFPGVLSGAVALHHSPERAMAESTAAMLVFAANRLDVSGFFDAPEKAGESLPGEYRERLPQGEDLVRVAAKAADAYEGIMQELGLSG